MVDYRTNEVIDILRSLINEEVELEIREVVKNNGVKLTGIMVKRPDCNIAPIMYITPDMDELSAYDVASRLYLSYTRRDEPVITKFEWEDWKDHLKLKLINTEYNKEILKDLVSFPFMELAAVPYIDMVDISGTVNISHKLAKYWNKTPLEVFSKALDNVVADGYLVKTMSDTIEELTGNTMPDIFGMYVVSNKDRALYGAVQMLNEHLFKDISEKLGDLYVIPSSIHELIVIPAELMDVDGVNEIIREVNSTHIKPEEVLADRVFLYKKDEGWI